jgi:hypothetical protein
MRKAQVPAPDNRPALAFDNQQEAYLIKDALNNHKHDFSAFHQEKIEELLDEIDHIIEMFNSKEL